MLKRRSIKDLLFVAIAFNLCLLTASAPSSYVVVVVGALPEERWIKHLFSETPEIPKGNWNTRAADHGGLQAIFEASTSQHFDASDQNKSWANPPTLFVTNLLADPRIHAALLAYADSDPRTGLAVVDEANSLADADCAQFRFVLRVGFAHYSREKHPGSPPRPLWWQPSNSLLVPLGTPATFPSSQEVPYSLANRPATQRSFTAAFAGHTQNVNRKLALEGLAKLPGLSLVHELIESPPSSPPSQGSNATMLPTTTANHHLTSAQYMAWLADAALAPSPPSNHHPECYRTYEALEAGALPVVDSDYYSTLWGSGASFLTVQPEYWDILSALHALDPAGNSTTISKSSSNNNKNHEGPSSTKKTELTPAALEALEHQRMKAVAWWRRLRDEVLPRQVANLVRFTSLEHNNSLSSAEPNPSNTAQRTPDEMSGIDNSYLSNLDRNYYSISGAGVYDTSCDSGVVGDATFKALTWSLGLGNVVVTGGGLGSTRAVAEALLRGTGSRTLVHVVGSWHQTPIEQSNDGGDVTVNALKAAGAAWNVESGIDCGCPVAAAEKHLNRVKPCGGGLPGRVRFKESAAKPQPGNAPHSDDHLELLAPLKTGIPYAANSIGSQTQTSVDVNDHGKVLSTSTLASASFANSTLGVVWLEEECTPGTTSQRLLDALNAWWPRLKPGGALAGSNFVGSGSPTWVMPAGAFSVAANANMVAADTIVKWVSTAEGAQLDVSTSYDATYYFGPSWRIYRHRE